MRIYTDDLPVVHKLDKRKKWIALNWAPEIKEKQKGEENQQFS